MTYYVVVRRTGPHWDPARPLEAQEGWAEHAAFMDGLVLMKLRIPPSHTGHRRVLAVLAYLQSQG